MGWKRQWRQIRDESIVLVPVKITLYADEKENLPFFHKIWRDGRTGAKNKRRDAQTQL